MKKSSRFTGLVLMLVGAMVLLNNLGKPRVEALHGSEHSVPIVSSEYRRSGFDHPARTAFTRLKGVSFGTRRKEDRAKIKT